MILMKLPTQGNLRDRCLLMTRSDLLQNLDDVECFFDIDRRKVHLHAASLVFFRSSAREFSGEESACERAPGEQTDFLILKERNDFVFQVSSCERVVRLQRGELLQILTGGDSERLHDLPCSPVRAADVADLA